MLYLGLRPRDNICALAKTKLMNVTAGVLLLHQSVHDHWPDGNARQVRHDRNRGRHGRHDPDLHTLDGQEREANPSLVRTRRNVRLLNLHHDLVLSQGHYLNIHYSQFDQMVD